jgi:hypothetical protein
MDIADLFKNASLVSSPWAIGAYAMASIVAIVLIFAKYKDRPLIARIAAAAIACIFLLAISITVIVIVGNRPGTTLSHPDKIYKLSVGVSTPKGIPLTNREITVTVDNGQASQAYVPGSNLWVFEIDSNALASNRQINISAYTNDKKYSTSRKDTLGQGSNMDYQLVLDNTPPPPTTFSINLADQAIIRDIENATGLKYASTSSRNKILVTYDANSITHNDGVFIFTRSSPVVLIDGIRFTLENCFIPASRPTQNEQLVKDYGNDQAIAAAIPFLKQHPRQLATWINSKR